MTLLFSVLIILACVLLILIILVQNPKGGGLSSSFGGGGTQMFGGVKKTSDFLDRGTWVLAIALVSMVLLSNVMLNPEGRGAVQEESELSKELQNTPQPISTGIPQNQQPASSQEAANSINDFAKDVEEEGQSQEE